MIVDRIFYYLAELVRFCKKKSCCVGKDKVDKRVVDTKRYQKLLNTFLQNKMQADFEKSPQDDFVDLRKDLENFMTKKFQKIQTMILKGQVNIDLKE